VINVYQINRDDEIRTRDRLIIKALILYQKTNSSQKFKPLGKVPEYNLYYFLTNKIPRFFLKALVCIAERF
jgi:hypothetical protein